MNVFTIVISALVLMSPITNQVKLENMNLNYRNGAGQATVAKAQFNLEGLEWSFKDTTLDVTDRNGTLVIQSPENDFFYELNFPLLQDIEVAELSNLWGSFSQGNLNLRLSSAVVEKDNETNQLRNAAINCNAPARMVDSIEACIYSGELNVSSFSNNSTSISDAKLTIQRGRTQFEVRIGGVGRITGSGTTTHDIDQATVSIKVDRVRLGILDITGRVFKMLEDVDSDTITVSRPYIHIKYAKE
jgi:hypothetical protein